MTAQSQSRRGQKFLSLAAALSVGTLATFGAALPSTAATSAENIGNIDGERQGSLTIHKFEAPGKATMLPDGTIAEGGEAPKDPIAGLEFQVCEISGLNLIDVADNPADWAWLNKNHVAVKAFVSNVDPADGSSLEATIDEIDVAVDPAKCTTVKTGENGSTPTLDLPLGVYSVVEVGGPAGVVLNTSPEIVTIPTPLYNGVGDGKWVYDVNIYPKNTKTTAPEKDVDINAPGYAVGDNLDFTIKQTVPTLGEGEKLNKLVITDYLDTRLQFIDEDGVTSDDVVVKVGNTTLTPNQYVLTVDTRTIDGVVREMVRVSITDPAVLAGFEEGGSTIGAEVSFKFTAKVMSMSSDVEGEEDGTFANTAFVNINDWFVETDEDGEPTGPENPNPGQPTNETVTRFGQIKALKVAKDENSKPLAGAEFDVYYTDVTDAGKCEIPLAADATRTRVPSASPVTSDENGVIDVAGLFIDNDKIWYNEDGSVDSNKSTYGVDARCYILVETKAPSGFVLPTGVDAETAFFVETGKVANGTVLDKIENTQTKVPELPLTGSAGTLVMVIGGTVLLIAGVGGVIVSRRQTAKN